MTALTWRSARMFRMAALVATKVLLLSSSTSFAADSIVIQIPGPPLLPTSRAQCEAYSRDIESRYQAVVEQHQSCLDARTKSQEPAGPTCSKAGCQSLHYLMTDLERAKSKNTSNCYTAVSEYEREQQSKLNSLQDAQRRAETIADSYRAGSGAEPSPESDSQSADSAAIANQLAAAFGRRGSPASPGLDSSSLPSISFQSPFSDTASDALRAFWQKDVKQVLLDGVVKVLGDHQPLAAGLDTAISSAETLRGVTDFLNRLSAASSIEERFDLAQQSVGAVTSSALDFAAGRGWLPPSYAVSGFAFDHAMSAVNVAAHGSLERLQYAVDFFSSGSRDWGSFDRNTDFNSLGRDIALAMCPICGKVMRMERVVTSTYEDLARWYAH